MNAVPPKLSRTNPGARLAMVVLALIAAGIAALVFSFNPTTHNFYPVCQFHRLTGLNCPGCGMTRALYALLHGDVVTALHDNALLVISMVVVPARGVWVAAKNSGGQAAVKLLPGQYLWPLLFVVLLFTILRNLPAFAFLSPS